MAVNPRSTNSIPHPIGDSVRRIDAQEKVTGAAIYTDDFQFGPGLLYARILRSPIPHGLIRKIDVDRARSLPGVKAIVTGADFPDPIGLSLHDRHIFCRERVRYVGDPIAAVAATSEEIAEQAIQLIEVEYEPLPAIFEPDLSLRPDTPLLHPDLGGYTVKDSVFPEGGTNIANHFRMRKGDPGAAWCACAVVVEREFRIPPIHHAPIEPHVTVAKAAQDGKLTIWGSIQSPFSQRELIASALSLPQNEVDIIAPYLGGGFGGKSGASIEVLAAAIATRVKGRPVKLRLTREEEFCATFVRQALVSRFKIGCDAAGKIQAIECTFYWDAGAYADNAVNITRSAVFSGAGPYDAPNVQIDSYCMYTNHPAGGPMRGFGMPEIQAGLEQTIDELAAQTAIDPVEFRSLNCLKSGGVLPNGITVHPTDLCDCIRKAADQIGWGEVKTPVSPNLRRGKGLAVMWKAPNFQPSASSSAWVELNEDGTITVAVGGQELGQGTFTVMAQMAAAAIGVPYEWVRLASPVNTDYSPYEFQTMASRLTWSMGNAVVSAALDARRQILEMVAAPWGEHPEDLDLINGQIISYKSESSLSLRDLNEYVTEKLSNPGWTSRSIVGRGSFSPGTGTGMENDTLAGGRGPAHYTTGAQAVEVEVDLETGQVTVLRSVSAFDVGKAINPDMVRAQIEGGFVQGLSTALFEELNIQDGILLNPNFRDYRIATAGDIPERIDAIIVEYPQADGPWGARGIGEHAFVPTIPAIANAIYAATGIRPGNPPFTAEKIYKQLCEAGLSK